MRGLSEKHRIILNLLLRYPQGLTLTQITKEMQDEKSNIYDSIKRLISKQYLERKPKGTFKLLIITELGKEMLNVLQAGAMGSMKPLTSSNQIKQGSTPKQRLHAVQVNSKLYRTSYDKVQGILDFLRIPYRKTATTAPQYIIEWKGIKLKITTKKLIGYGKQIEAPLEINGNELRERALIDTSSIMEDFLQRTNIRCDRDLEGNLIVLLRNWEIAFTNNEIARRLTQKGGWIAIAYNRITGLATIHADQSFTNELEANEDRPHTELRKWGQGIQDGIIRPYDDELRTRQELQDLTGLTRQAIELAKTSQDQINIYAKQIELHLKVMRKIDQKLSQKKLSDF